MQAMTQQEMLQSEGGVAPVVVALIWFSGVVIGATVTGIAENWPDFKKGVMEGFNGTVASN
jgi:lactobin A/cerein 7B family class IIb bacteriocin